MTVLRARYGDSGAEDDFVKIDPSTLGLIALTYDHAEIHEGNAFTVSQVSASNGLDIAAPLTFSVVTPNTTKWGHLIASADCNNPCILEIYEDNGVALEFNVSGGSSVTPKNRNRNSATVSGMTVKSGVTVTAAAVAARITTRVISRAGTNVFRQEIVLKQNTMYLVRLYTYTDNNEGGLSLDWYEHTSKH